MCPSGATYLHAGIFLQGAITIKNATKRVALVQSGHNNHFIKWNMFSWP